MKKSFFTEYLQPHTAHILFASLCSILNKLCDIVPEILIGIAIDVVVNQHVSLVAHTLGIRDPLMQLYVVGGLTALLWILESVFEYLYLVSWRSIAQEIQHQLRLDTYNHIQHCEMSYFENKTTGGLTTILNDDINQLEQFLSEGPNAFIQLFVNIVSMGGIFFYLSPLLAFTTLIPIPFVIAIAYFFQKALAQRYAAVRRCVAQLSGHINSKLLGITTIKSYTAEAHELATLTTESSAYKKANHAASVLNALYIPLVRMGILCGFVASLVLGGIAALEGTMSLSAFSILVFLTQRFLWPFTTLTTITDMYERAMASLHNIQAILDHSITIKDGINRQQLPLSDGTISIENISFTYPNGTSIYTDLSCTIPKNKTVAFIGTTGSGKSTLVKLLLRLYEVTGGTIRIGPIDINTLTLQNLRSHSGLVSQDLYLTNNSIAENIAYTVENPSMSDIIAAAHTAQAHEFIMSLPNQYHFIVGENGKNLSGGQRQRIAIARALFKKPSLLIFDEATSALDNETEAAIKDAIESLAHTQTIIIIAHRLSTIRNADRIYVLEKGSITEVGTHAELIQHNGTYTKLWRLQTGG